MALETVVVNDENLFDILIIGAGPAGLTAAIYGARSGLKTAFIERNTPGGKVVGLTNITNYPGIPSIKGSVLAASFYRQAEQAGAKYLYANVINVIRKLGYWCCFADDGKTFFTKALIIATGTENISLNIEGEKQFEKIGVSYCVTCDAPLCRNKIAVVIGDTTEAYSGAIYLSTVAKKVYLICNNNNLTNTPLTLDTFKNKNIDVIFGATPLRIYGDTFYVNSITYKDINNSISTLECNFIFIEKGFAPATGFLTDKTILSDDLLIKINQQDRSTDLEGIYAAGDVTRAEDRQIVNATSDGAIAAMSAIKYVKEIYDNKPQIDTDKNGLE